MVVSRPCFILFVCLVHLKVAQGLNFGFLTFMISATTSSRLNAKISFGALLKHFPGDCAPHSDLGALMHGCECVIVLSPEQIFRFLAHAEET
jgi:hypothetical protein